MTSLTSALLASALLQPGPIDNATLGTQAHAILKAHCVRCHNDAGVAKGGFAYVLDRERLVARAKVVPGKAELSPLFERVLHGEMPPTSQHARPSAEEVATLRRWIDAGAPAVVASGPRTFIGEADVLRAVLSDLQSLPATQRRYTRYLTLAHLSNAGLPDTELDFTRWAVAKLLNGLSWHPRITLPTVIDASRAIVRIDLRQYQWTARSWDRFAGIYPYRISADTPDARAISAATGCEVAMLRADWFVATATRPPLYYDLLQLPLLDRDLERQLRVEVVRDIEEETVVRAGFNDSGVSRNNRVIERHDMAHGAYWRTYDFAENIEQQNVFDHPLGPIAGRNSFRHAGGEIIFHLPNGLLAFFLADRDGRRLDRAPVEIVSDPGRPDRAVENGVSCVSCHGRGFLPKADQVWPHVEKNKSAFLDTDAATVKALYRPEASLRALVDQDNAHFMSALRQLGLPADGPEPITAVVRRYEGVLEQASAAGELGLSPEEFARRLGGTSSLTRLLGPLRVPGGTVQREVFEAAFPQLARELDIVERKAPISAVVSDARSFAGHDGLVTSIGFSADGRLALSGGADRTVRLWEVATGRELRRFEGHSGAVDAVAFSPDGLHVVAAGADRCIYIWDRVSGREQARLTGHTDRVLTAVFSPDGRSILSGGRDGTIRLWDVARGLQLQCFTGHAGWVTALAFAPDGRHIASTSYDRSVRLWNLETGRQLASLEGHRRAVFCVAFSPDGRLVASGGEDCTVRLWDAASGRQLHCCEGHANAVIRVAFAADGRQIVSAASQYRTSDPIFRTWDAQSGAELSQGPTDAAQRVSVVGIGPDGRTALSGSSEGPLRLWNLSR